MSDGNGHAVSSDGENISATLAPDQAEVSTEPSSLYHSVLSAETCAYVVAVARKGRAARFCGRRAAKGSAYCPSHHALCCLVPGSANAARVARAQTRAADRAVPAPAALAPCAVPEPPDPTDGVDALADVRLPKPAAEGAEW